MPITIYGDGYITGLGNVSTSGSMTASNVALGNVTMNQDNLLGSVTSNGWQKLPSGLIIQWGTDTATGADHTVTFPIPFPNACFSVTVSGVAGGTYFIPFNRTPTTTGYQQNYYASGGSSGAATSWTGRYIAIGY